MRKVLLLLAIVAFGFGLASCKDKVDPADAKLQSAYDSLSALIADPSNITGGFEVPTTLVGGVTAVWESSNPGVVTVGASSNGFAVITVNRPKFGEANVNVTLSVTLSIKSELDDAKNLTLPWSVVLTVKANEVEEIVIENVADVLELTNPDYDGTYQVTLEGLTIFAKGSDASFAYDGTGIIQVYGGSQENLVVGKVYTIAATIDWYYGIWELTKWTATEETAATPANPTKQEIASVNTKLDALIAADEHKYSGQNASSGNMEPIYATVTGKVYMVPGDTGNYNTYIVDTAYDTTGTWVAGSAEAPARGLMVYYNTLDFATLRLYDGITVTIDVVIYTYRSNNQAFAIYYVGGPAGINATLTDQQKLDIDADAITVPTAFTAAGTVALPTSGTNGSAIAWTSSNATLINPTTGVVTLPAEGAEIVTLTASVTYGALTAVVVNFKVLVGELPTVTMAGHLELAKGDLAYAEVEILYLASNGKSAVVGDSTGYGYIYATFDMSKEVAVGQFVGVTFTIDIYNGLYELINVSFSEAEGTDPNLTPTAATWTSVEATALLSDTAWAPAYVTMELVGYASGDYTNAYLKDFLPAYVQTNGGTSDLRNKVFTATGWIIGKSSSKITIQGTYTNVVDLTDWANVTLDTADLKLTTTSFTEATTVTLPVAGTRGTTIAWASSNADLFNVTTGAVTLPASGSVDVTLTATISKGTESETKAIKVTITKPAGPVTPVSDLFISEYIEGSSNNKAIEIYNPTGAAVDLSNYSVSLYVNGSQTPLTRQLSGTLAAGEVYVIANSQANAAILAQADLTIAYVDGAFGANWNGDDAIALLKGANIIDLFGVIGTDPGDFWVVGSGNTKDYTLVRKATVTGPVATWDLTQWEVLAKDTTTSLGAHVFTPAS